MSSLRTFFQEFKTDAGQTVTAEYFYVDGGSCVCVKDAWIEPATPSGLAVEVVLTDVEHERFADWVMEHRHWSDHDDSNED